MVVTRNSSFSCLCLQFAGGKVSPLLVWTSSSTAMIGDHSVTITVPSTIESQIQKQLDQLMDVAVIGTLKYVN